MPQAAKTLQQLIERQQINTAFRERESGPLSARCADVARRRAARGSRSSRSTSTWCRCAGASCRRGTPRARGGRRRPSSRAAGRAGQRIVEGLAPAPRCEVSLAGERVRNRPGRSSPPPGRELARIATISDIHIGERRFGRWPRSQARVRSGAMRPSRIRSCAPRRAARGARVGSAADRREGRPHRRGPDEEYEVLPGQLAAVPVPVVVIPGNHDGGDRSAATASRCSLGHGIELTTVRPRRRRPRAACGRRELAPEGRQAPRQPHATAARDHRRALSGAPGRSDCSRRTIRPVRTVVTTIWPPGILGLDGWRLLRAVSAAHSDTSSRRGTRTATAGAPTGGMPITEVGSPKDFPGVWAGYVVHEGGIRQVVRRVCRSAGDRLDRADVGCTHGVVALLVAGQTSTRGASRTPGRTPGPVSRSRRVTRRLVGRA